MEQRSKARDGYDCSSIPSIGSINFCSLISPLKLDKTVCAHDQRIIDSRKQSSADLESPIRHRVTFTSFQQRTTKFGARAVSSVVDATRSTPNWHSLSLTSSSSSRVHGARPCISRGPRRADDRSHPCGGQQREWARTHQSPVAHGEGKVAVKFGTMRSSSGSRRQSVRCDLTYCRKKKLLDRFGRVPQTF